MRCNIGKRDKTIRVIAGVAVLIIGMVYNSWFALIGIALLATALIRFCPAYLPFKIDTSKNDDTPSGCGGCGCGR